MQLLILGATGMAGHTIALYMQEQGHDVVTITRKPFKYCKNIINDLQNLEVIERIIHDYNFTSVINCVGVLNQNAELHKHSAVFLNSYLPHYLCDITKHLKTKVIQISTDCVFSGKTGNYNESSLKDGETFYDRSKSLGELDNIKDLTFRNSIIGSDINNNGIGLFNWFMMQSGTINGYTQAIWTGVTTLTLAKAMEKAIKQDLCGLYHLVNNIEINKYDLLQLFNGYFKDGSININKDSSIKLNKSLKNSRRDFSFDVPSYEEMIRDMKDWVYTHKELYPHYFK
jgi:dTDP-4-dehydrorhamnose reductase